MNNAPIGIFDSGLGGLTVAQQIREMLPHESLIYLGDTARCPYGPQDPRDVRRYVLEIGGYLVDRGVKMIVIACNTATAAGLALAQQVFEIPVIGVVEPGARAAVRATHTRRIGVIGTQGTVNSGAYSRAVRSIDAGVTVFSAATPLFVDIVEEGLLFEGARGTATADDRAISQVYIDPKFYELARDYLSPLKRSNIDTLILGCTHFPLLQTAIGQVMGSQVQLISSAEETADEVRATLDRSGTAAPVPAPGAAPTYEFVTTGSPRHFARLGSRIFGDALSQVQSLDVSQLESALTPERAHALADVI